MKLRQVVTMCALGLCTSGAPLLGQAASLGSGEEAHLIFMREEEKLARDVYLALSEAFPEENIFIRIAESEQNHTNIVLDTLEFYNIDDPDPDTNDLPGSTGDFTGADYGDFFDDTYAFLVGWGSESLLDALYVGAYIVELNMHNIVDCPHVIIETDPAVEAGECGLEFTDTPRLQNVYTNLLEGSKDHFRSFVQNIEVSIGDGEYQAQVLSQEEVDNILADQGNKDKNNR